MDKKIIPATWLGPLLESEYVKDRKTAFAESEIARINEKNKKLADQLEALRNIDKKSEDHYELVLHPDRTEENKKEIGPTDIEKLIDTLRVSNSVQYLPD